MKLILCPDCQDVKKLQYKKTYCECRKSFGRYLSDGLNAEINSNAIPLGFDNFSLSMSVRNRPETGLGKVFTAFIIQKKCDTIKIIGDEKNE